MSSPAPVSPVSAWPLALALAAEAIGLSDPNPRVGCVIVSADGTQVLGEGHTQEAGGAHAEVVALRDAAARGHDVRGATVFVTLEPCAHHGRTPPCCDALIAAGVARVEMAGRDPDPRVDGQGAAKLAAAGIVVADAPADIVRQATELNLGFVSRMLRGRPWVRLKVAASMDGRTALPGGESRWITGADARADGHAWRRRAGLVLTGIGTVRADDPVLDVRLVPTARQPVRAVVDARLETPLDARLFSQPSPVLLLTASQDADRRGALQARGAEIVDVPADAAGRLPPAAILRALAGRELNELHLEGGARLNGAWLASGLVDEIVVYLAPRLLGEGAGMALLERYERLAEAPEYRIVHVRPLGDDLRILMRPVRPAAAL